MRRFYVDTNIWLDYFENRSDKYRPLGEWALAFLNGILDVGSVILISDVVLAELRRYADQEKISSCFAPFQKSLLFVSRSNTQSIEARSLSKSRLVPFADALHAIISRDENAILISRDKHFMKLLDVVCVMKPEDLI
ncbi:PIN domain-containing protein [Candidatus Woesearchaeota archaeon]|nr:PIN domain-containing protein [Candidatus Woesearchaeota archaeon]